MTITISRIWLCISKREFGVKTLVITYPLWMEDFAAWTGFAFGGSFSCCMSMVFITLLTR